jgi:hypothetical protein
VGWAGGEVGAAVSVGWAPPQAAIKMERTTIRDPMIHIRFFLGILSLSFIQTKLVSSGHLCRVQKDSRFITSLYEKSFHTG